MTSIIPFIPFARLRARAIIVSRLSIVLVISIATYGCSRQTDHGTADSVSSAPFDTSTIAIIPYDSIKHLQFIEGRQAVVTKAEVAELNNLFSRCVSGFNVGAEKNYIEDKKKFPGDQLKKDSYVLAIDRYKRQYIAVINEKGEKVVWINCYCSNEAHVSKDVEIVLDGGNCYFNLKVNLTDKKCSEFSVNGEA